MSHRLNKVRKRIAKRRRANDRFKDRPAEQIYDLSNTFEDELPSIYESKTPIHPLWNREVFLFKVLAAIVLVLAVGIVFQSPSPIFNEARTVVKKTMGEEFQFAAVADWYENQFGKPLALFPDRNGDRSKQLAKEGDYALPVGAKISEEFSHDGRGIMIETENQAQVEAMADGIVIFSGKKEDIGQTVIIQHADQTETWYGKMDKVNVKPHEHVKGGKAIGTVSPKEDQVAGQYYFAIKKEDEFIDPIQVMNLD